MSEAALVDAVERTMDEAGFETAHLLGNSLGGYLALQLAARGRADSVVALAPAGGWAEGDDSVHDTLALFSMMQELLGNAAPFAETILASEEGRRRSTEFIVTNFEHIPTELLAHALQGAAACTGAVPMLEYASQHGWDLDAERIECPVRVVWGTADRILPWPGAAVRFRDSWLPRADWVELDGVGHSPQLDVPTETAELVLDFTAR